MVRPRKKINKRAQLKKKLEKTAVDATSWIGSIESLLIHTLVFLVSFSLVLFGVPIDRVLLVLTTVLSLEAIYLAIFIQMSVNRNTLQLKEVEKDIEEIQEDVEDISEDIEGIEKDIEEIQEDVEGIEKDVEEIAEDVEEIQGDVEEMAEEKEPGTVEEKVK